MILEAFLISLKVVTLAIIFSCVLSILLAYLLVERNYKFKSFIETIIIFPMFLPPSAVGYIILLVLGKRGIIGEVLYNNFDISIIFTWIGAVIVGIVVSIPIMYQSLKTSLLGVDLDVKNAAIEMGATKFKLYRLVSLPLSKKGIYTGLILGIARVFGEFGATILVAGNIQGKTQTVPMAMYYAIENGESGLANEILILIVIISVVLTFFYNKILKKLK
ncbi:molybdate ABC transporter permease subunit [Clostridium sp. B9]|uniref:molybdate ABC transporter permease subunit n=1 Tax=Clostridium sp. B9 TaxID=3423224 RepID=UPI003D2F4005